MSDPVEVKVGAQTGDVKAQFDTLSQSVGSSLRNIGDGLARLAGISKKTTDETAASNLTLGRSFSDLKTSIGTSLEAIRVGVNVAGAAVLGMGLLLGAAFVGGAKTAVSATIALQSEVDTLQRVMGMGAHEAMGFSIALKLAGTNANAFTGIALNVGRMVRSDADEFKRLGVEIFDGNKNLLSTEQIMRNVYQRMQEFKAGTDQNMVALALTGRSAKDFAETMENLERVTGRAIQMQKDLGLEFSEEQQEKVKDYKVELNAFGVVADSIALKIGMAVLPQFQGIAAWMNTEGPRAANVIVGAFKLILSALTLTEFAVTSLAIRFAAGMEAMQTIADARTQAISALLKGRLISALPEAWDAMYARLKRIQAQGNSEIEAAQLKTTDTLEKLFAKITPGAGGGGGSRGGLAFPIKPKKESGGAEPSIMSELEAELKALRDKYERAKLDQGSFEQWSVQQTSAYWQQILNSTQLSAKDREAVLGKYYDAEREARLKSFAGQIATLDAEAASFKFNYAERIRIAQEAYAKIATAFGTGDPRTQAAARKVQEEKNAAAEQAMRLAEVEARREEASANHGVAMDALATRQKLALRQITAEQGLALERQSEDRLYAIKKAALDKLKALEADGPNDPVKLAQIQSQIEDLTQRHEEKLTEITNSAQLERNKYAIEGARQIEDAFAGFLSSLGNSTKSLKDKLLDFGNSIARIITELAAKKLAASLLGAGTEGGGLITSLLTAILGGGGSPSIPSFATGTNYVPRTGLALIHEGERITPASQNRSGGGSREIHVHNHFPATVDGRTINQAALATGRAVQKASYQDG